MKLYARTHDNLPSTEIIAMRNAMWEKVSTRSHKPSKVFPFGPNAEEVMLFGTVEFTFKEGGGSAVDWAARAKLVQEGGKVKMGFYQVYMVSAVSRRRARVDIWNIGG